MIIRIGKHPISTSKARAIAMQIIDTAASVDRYHAASAQARHHPESMIEREHAAQANIRARGAMLKLQEMIAEAKGMTA